jgi:acyl-coenzyme A synthetase/AMP-(fatty) acid ligase|tara:strand:- start:360 stop:476 length:117 start_codon:yes stop_codon:yes gene_type:complete
MANVSQHRHHAIELGDSILNHPEVAEEAPVAFQPIQRL